MCPETSTDSRDRTRRPVPRRFDLSPQWARGAARTMRRFVPGDPIAEYRAAR